MRFEHLFLLLLLRTGRTVLLLLFESLASGSGGAIGVDCKELVESEAGEQFAAALAAMHHR